MSTLKNSTYTNFWNLMDTTQAESDKRTTGWNGANQHSLDGLSSGLITPLQAALVALFNGCCRDVSRSQVSKLLSEVMTLSQPRIKICQAKTVATCFNIQAHCRDCRGGKGEKDASRYLLLELYRLYPEATLKMLPLQPEFGYWKDFNLIIADCHNCTEYAPLIDKIYNIMYSQIITDYRTLKSKSKNDNQATIEGTVYDHAPNLSLCAKWIPKEGRGMDRKYGVTSRLAKLAFPEIYAKDRSAALKQWRIIVSSLNKAINTVEILMSKGEFNKIKFKLVSGRVTNICRRAFLNLKGGKNSKSNSPRSDSPRRITGRENMLHHIQQAKEGKTTMKGTALHLHEIVKSMLILNGFQPKVNNGLTDEEKTILQCQWNDHRTKLFESINKCQDSDSVFNPRGVVMIDESGSMAMPETPILAANAIGIMLTELCAEFGGNTLGNRFLTFATDTKWVTFPPKASLYDKLDIATKSPWGGTTNFIAAHNHILQLCITHKLSPTDIPNWFMVLSDMQYNRANSYTTIPKDSPISRYCTPSLLSSGQNITTHHEILVSAYKNAGLAVCGQAYKLPFTYYWNLNGSVSGYPVQADTPNTMMLSGFSTEMISLLFSGQIQTVVNRKKTLDDNANPANSWDLLVAAMETKTDKDTYRYDDIHNTLSKCGGIFKYYTSPFNSHDIPKPDISHNANISFNNVKKSSSDSCLVKLNEANKLSCSLPVKNQHIMRPTLTRVSSQNTPQKKIFTPSKNLRVDTTYKREYWTATEVSNWVSTLFNKVSSFSTVKISDISKKIINVDVDGALLNKLANENDHISLTELGISSKILREKIFLEWSRL